MIFKNRLDAILILLSVFALNAVLITLAVVPPATGYESELHAIYPPCFWILIGGLLLLPIGYLLVTYLSKKIIFSWRTAYWLLGTAIFTAILTKLFPLARGYFAFGAGDTQSHYGTILDILSTGVFSSDNHYPFIHIDVAETVLITGLTPELSALLIHTVMYGFSLLAFIIIGQRVFHNQKLTILLTSLGAIPLYLNEILTPNNFGFWIIFFFIFLVCVILFTQDEKEILPYSMMAFLYALTICFLHPETVTDSAIILIVIIIAAFTYSHSHKRVQKLNYLPVLFILVVLCISWFSYISETSAFTGQLKGYSPIIFGVLSGDWTNLFFASSEKSAFDALSPSSYAFFETVVLSIMLYGKYLALIVLSTITIFGLLLHKLIRKRTVCIGMLNSAVISAFVVYCVYALANMISGSTTGLNPTRMLKVVLVIAVFLLVMNIERILKHKNKILNGLYIILLCTGIVFTVFISVGQLYGNYELNTTNAPIMEEDYCTWQIFLETRDDGYLIEETTSRNGQSRYPAYIYGGINKLTTNIRSFVAIGNNKLDEHFGYENGSAAFGEMFDTPRYFMLYPPYGEMKRFAVETPLLLGGFNASDVKHLNMDYSANKVITGGNNSVYLVYPMTSAKNSI